MSAITAISRSGKARGANSPRLEPSSTSGVPGVKDPNRRSPHFSPTRHFSPFVANKALSQFDACVALGWPKPNPRPNSIGRGSQLFAFGF
jgi:hypothetical protein